MSTEASAAQRGVGREIAEWVAGVVFVIAGTLALWIAVSAGLTFSIAAWALGAAALLALAVLFWPVALAIAIVAAGVLAAQWLWRLF